MSGTAGDLPIAGDVPGPDALARLLDERDARVRAWGRPAAPEAAAVAVLVARLGPVLVALPSERLAGVATMLVVTPLPGAPPALAGVFAHAGEVHSLLLPDAAIGLAPPAAGRTVALLLRGAGARLAFAVDEARAVTRAVPHGGGSRYARVDGGETVLLVDPDEVLTALGIGPAAERRSE